MAGNFDFVPADVPSEFDPESAVLFVGAGFSVGAPNVEKSTLPLGNPLKARLAALLGVSPDDYDLQTLSQEFASNDSEELYGLLYKIFTVTARLPDQSSILSFPWRRIYTTNYDDVIESADPKLPFFNYDDHKPRHLPRRFVAHLHGSIRRANPGNVLSQLVLNEASYVRQVAEPSPWVDEFSRDLRFASACYFIGYSLADHHITAVLHQSAESKSRTFFISSDNPGRIYVHRVQRYGGILPVGRRGFADLLPKIARPAPITDIKQLRSFKYIDPSADQKSAASITPLEVVNLITFGKFVVNRYIANYPAVDYVIPRSNLINEAVDTLESARTLLIHSRLGNGKTIFAYALALALSAKSIKCFYFRQESAKMSAEIELLNRSGRVMILFDDYDLAIEHISRLSAVVPEAKFVVTARSSQQAVRYHEIRESFPSPLRLLAVDRLDQQDKASLVKLLDQSGLSAAGLKQIVREARELRDIILAFYRNKEVGRKVSAALEPVIQNDSSKFVLISTHLGRWAAVDLTSDFISKAGRIDAYAEIMQHTESAQDLFTFEDGLIGIRSSLLAQYLLEEHFTAKDICEVCHDLIIAAVDRKGERKYRKLMAGLMQVGDLKRITQAKKGARESILEMFERLARDTAVNQEPLFWLQFAILMVEMRNYDAAERFLDTSYERANISIGFQTYQLDTQALRIALIVETESTSSGVERSEKILKGFRDVLPMITDESHRFFAIRLLELVEPFCINRGISLSNNEKILFVFEISRLVQALSSFDSHLRAQTGSDAIKATLERSVAMLSRPSLQ